MMVNQPLPCPRYAGLMPVFILFSRPKPHPKLRRKQSQPIKEILRRNEGSEEKAASESASAGSMATQMD